MLFRKKITYLMDENVKMSLADIEKLSECVVINSTDKFPNGTADEILTKASLKNDWIIVTKDIRMALRSLVDGVKVVFISDDFKTITYLSVNIYGGKKFPSMYEYIKTRFGYSVTPEKTQ